MTCDEVMAALKKMGSASIKKVLTAHGAREPFFGVKVGDMKTLVKKIKKDYQLALDLYDTGNSDAMYLAGLIADDARMTVEDLDKWVEKAYWHMLSEYTVPWVAAGSPHGFTMARRWIDVKSETIAAAGWSTWSGLVALKSDDELDLNELRQLLKRIVKTIKAQPNRVRYAMNGFVIAVGSYVCDLTPAAHEAAAAIGKVHVEMGGTSCKVPDAAEYIDKVIAKGNHGKKKKTVKC